MSILAEIENCKAPQPYWLAWGASCLRFGRGLDPTTGELTGMCLKYRVTQTDFYVGIASHHRGRSTDHPEYGSMANWTVYRQSEVSFNGKSVSK